MCFDLFTLKVMFYPYVRHNREYHPDNRNFSVPGES